MSERRQGRAMRLAMRTAATIVLVAPTVAAQGTPRQPTAAEYRARLDSLVPLWRQATASAADAERIRQHRTAARTYDYEGLRFVADSAALGYVAAAAARVWPLVTATFGSDASMLRDHPLVIEHRWTFPRGADSVGVLYIGRLRDGAPHWEHSASLSDTATGIEQLSGIVRVAAVRPLFESLDVPLKAWLGHPLPAGGEQARDLEAVFVALASWSAPIARQCVAGELAGCRRVLGLTEPDDPITETMTARRRRDIVASHSRDLRTFGHEADYDRCVRNDDDASCTRRLRALSPDRLRLSRWTPGQSSLVQYALARGGADAHARLRATASLPIDARLAAASGMHADSLVMGWRRHVMGAQPSPAALSPSAAAVALFYILACGALATRSSRWR